MESGEQSQSTAKIQWFYLSWTLNNDVGPIVGKTLTIGVLLQY